MENPSSFRNNVVTSVIASIIVLIFVEPIVAFLWSLVVDSGLTVIKWIVNLIYINAALGHRNYIDVIILIIIATLPVSYFMFTYFPTVKVLRDKFKNKDSKIMKTTFRIMDVIAFLSLVFFLISVIIDLQINTSFQQRLAAVNPVISENQYKQILADWANMKSRQDYIIINNRLDSLASIAKVPIPEPLLR